MVLVVLTAALALALVGRGRTVHPRDLQKRTPAAYAPEPAIASGPARGGPPHPLAVGQLLETRLAFRIPGAAAGVRLSARPTATAAPIVVALGR